MGSANNCSSCPTGIIYYIIGTVLYNGACTASCPANYFNISNVCETCGNCVSCTSVTICTQCLPGYFMFNSVCYSVCPPQGIPDTNNMICVPCDSSCLTCSGTTTNCSSCKGGTYLYTGINYNNNR